VIFCITPDPAIVGSDRRETSTFLPMTARRMVGLMPKLANLKVPRPGPGLYPLTPDYSPLVAPPHLPPLRRREPFAAGASFAPGGRRVDPWGSPREKPPPSRTQGGPPPPPGPPPRFGKTLFYAMDAPTPHPYPPTHPASWTPHAVMTGRDLPAADPYYGHALKDRPVLAIDRAAPRVCPSSCRGRCRRSWASTGDRRLVWNSD